MKLKKQTAEQLLVLFLVKLGISNSPVAYKIVRARKILTLMKGNAYFPNPEPKLNVLDSAIAALEDAEAAMDGSKIKTEQRNMALNTFNAVMKQLQAYVEVTANGNVEIILSSGFEVRNHATKPVLLVAPVNVTAKVGALTGEIDMKWKSNRKAKLNVIEHSTDPVNGKWELAAQATKATITLTGYTPGEKQYFRVAHINAAGIGPYSDVVEGRASF